MEDLRAIKNPKYIKKDFYKEEEERLDEIK